MSEHAEVEEVAEEPSMLQRFRWPLLAGGIVLGLIVFLLIGMVLGTVRQRSSDRKLLAAQVAAIKQQAKLSEDERKIQAAKAESFRLTADSRKTEIAELRSKLDCIEAAASQVEAAERAKQALLMQEQKNQQEAKARAETPTKTGYVRFSNTSCTLVAGKGNASGLECLKQGVSGNNHTKPAAAAIKVEEPGIDWRACLKQGNRSEGSATSSETLSHKSEEKPAEPAHKSGH